MLRALAAWRMEWVGAPRIVILTGSPGSGRSHLLTGFLMLCDPEFRRRLPLADLDPSTVPPELPAPAVPSAAGLTAAQIGWLLADHYGLQATRIEDVYAELAALDRTVTVVVPDVDQAGPVRTTGEPARVVQEVLRPLATTANARLLASTPACSPAATPPGRTRRSKVVDRLLPLIRNGNPAHPRAESAFQRMAPGTMPRFREVRRRGPQHGRLATTHPQIPNSRSRGPCPRERVIRFAACQAGGLRPIVSAVRLTGFIVKA